MKAISCNQRNGGHRKALCPGAPQDPLSVKKESVEHLRRLESLGAKPP